MEIISVESFRAISYKCYCFAKVWDVNIGTNHLKGSWGMGFEHIQSVDLDLAFG